MLDISKGSTPSEQNINLLLYIFLDNTSGTISFKSLRIEPSLIITHIPRRSRSNT
ncbi:MAG: Uncharacterised protein [Candidatus Nitrosopelagicus brevis]|nr:MAG: Uncharacterised protein [Candidatus Nitrosopelagicus brevis]